MGLSLLEAARQVPDRLAWITPQRNFTYGELGPRIEAAVAWLVEQGLTVDGDHPGGDHPDGDNSVLEGWPEPRVSLLGESSFAALVVFQALVELGIACVMVHPRLARDERARWIAECRPRLDVDAARLALAAAWIEEDLAGKAARGRRVLAGLPPTDGERCLAIVRTSGSTGRPKGVVLSRLAFVASAKASSRRLGWCEDDRWLLSLPLAHVGGLSILTRCTLARGTVVVPSWTRFRADEVLRTLEADRVTLLSLVPTMLRRLLALSQPPPATLRAVLLGGAAASPALLGEAVDRGWPVLTTYGLTETCSQVTSQPYGTVNRGEMGSGPPLDGVDVRIRDGVIEVRGPILMSGYAPRKGASPWTADGWLRTSDLGRFDEAGNLHVRGRLDDVLISGGENVAPLEIEQALEALPAIVEACVFGVPDAAWGQAVAAAVVLREGADFELAELEELLRDRLASFARPRYVARVAALARAANGKVDRLRTAQAVSARLEPC